MGQRKMGKAEKRKAKEIISFNIYYRQLCFVAIAIIWGFTGGFWVSDDGKFLLYPFIATVAGLFIDFINQIRQRYNWKFNCKSGAFFYSIFQIIIIFYVYAEILYYFITIFPKAGA